MATKQDFEMILTSNTIPSNAIALLASSTDLISTKANFFSWLMYTLTTASPETNHINGQSEHILTPTIYITWKNHTANVQFSNIFASILKCTAYSASNMDRYKKKQQVCLWNFWVRYFLLATGKKENRKDKNRRKGEGKRKKERKKPGPAVFPPIAVMTWLKNAEIVCLEGKSKIYQQSY